MASMFTCEPDCANRRPGCQDHCEKHKREKAAWDERRAILQREASITNYVIEEIYKNQRR